MFEDFEKAEFILTITHEDGTVEKVETVGIGDVPELKDCTMPDEVTINGIVYRRVK